MDDFDVYLHATETYGRQSEKQNAVRQGIIHSGGCTVNCIKLRINAKDSFKHSL